MQLPRQRFLPSGDWLVVLIRLQRVSVLQYLGRPGGPGGVEDVERVVGGEGHAVMGLSLGHLLVPVEAKVSTQRHLLLQEEEKTLLILLLGNLHNYCNKAVQKNGDYKK